MTSNLERRQANLDRFGYRYLENALTGHLLGQDYLLSSFSASIARKGGIVEAYTDQWWMPWPILP